MNALFTHEFFQHYWWFIVSVLGSALVCLLFIQGGQTLLYTLAKNDKERALLVNLLGRKWELTFTTLVTFGGGFFASFPLFYSTSFGGAYWLWMLILFCFVIQAVSYEYRSKPSNMLGRKTYDVFLFLNGLLGSFLLGAAVAMFYTGAPFSVNEMRFSQWENSWHGLEVFAKLLPWLLGFSVLFLSRVLAMLYFSKSLDDASVLARIRKRLGYEGLLFVVFFCSFLVVLAFSDGFAYNPADGKISPIAGKYLKNYLQIPLLLLMLAGGVLSFLYGWVRALLKQAQTAFWWCSGGAFVAVLSLWLVAGFNHTAFLPSLVDIQSSLTIQNSSASKYSLQTMSVVSLAIPFVAAYIVWAWKTLSSKKISNEELDGEHHKY